MNQPATSDHKNRLGHLHSGSSRRIADGHWCPFYVCNINLHHIPQYESLRSRTSGFCNFVTKTPVMVAL